MPILPAVVLTTVVCDVCGSSATHASPGSARAVFIRDGWLIAEPGQAIELPSGSMLFAACIRCAVIIRTLNAEPVT